MLLKHKKTIIITFILFYSSFLLSNPPQEIEEKGSLIKFAWEIPSYETQYDIAKSYLWTDPSGGGELYTGFNICRNKDNGDSRSVSNYAAFRPFVIEFENFSIAFGGSYLFGYEYFVEGNDYSREQNEDGSETTIYVHNIYGHLIYHAANFSLVASFPHAKFQTVLDVGYIWIEGKANFDSQVDDGSTILVYDNYMYKQRDGGIYFSIEFRKFFERQYLNYFSVLVYNVFRVTKTFRRSRANIVVIDKSTGDRYDHGEHELPYVLYPGTPYETIAPDPQEGKYFNTNYLYVALTARVFDIPYDIPNFIENQGIALDLIGAAEHSAGELFGDDFHGVGLTLGAQLSFFNILGVGFNYTWQINNDQADEWGVTLIIGIYGTLGPSGGKGLITPSS